jgi:predicted nucleotidyltransferase
MAQSLDRLPEETRNRLRELADTLRKQLGDNLVSLIAFGSAVRGGWREGKSDVDLVLVLRDTSREPLASIANTLTIARTARRFETMILAADELGRAADAFPLFYDDIKGCHALLAGKDAFAELSVSDEHRRLRIEQELREMQIRLRRAVVDALGSSSHIAGPIERKIRQLRGPLHALLALRGTPPANDGIEAVIDKAEEIYAVDAKALGDVRKDTPAALDALNTLLAKAIDEVDRLSV